MARLNGPSPVVWSPGTPAATATVGGVVYPASVTIAVADDGALRWEVILRGALPADAWDDRGRARLRLTTPFGVFDGDALMDHQEYIGIAPGGEPFRTAVNGCGPLDYVGPVPS